MERRNNQILLSLFTASLLIFGLNSCASIVGKAQPQSILINSIPFDADLKIENLRTGKTIYLGKTPYTATLEKSGGYFKSARYQITVAKEGYSSLQFRIEGFMNGWYLGGNLIFGGLIGWLIVDPMTGGMWTLSPDSINADLGTKTGLLKNDKGLMIVLKSDIPNKLLKDMTPIKISSQTTK